MARAWTARALRSSGFPSLLLLTFTKPSPPPSKELPRWLKCWLDEVWLPPGISFLASRILVRLISETLPDANVREIPMLRAVAPMCTE